MEEEDGVVLGKGTENESDFAVNENKQDEVEKGLHTKCDDDELGEEKDEETVKPVRVRKEFSTSSASVNIFPDGFAGLQTTTSFVRSVKAASNSAES